MDLTIRDSVLGPNEKGQSYFLREAPGRKNRYRVWLYLEGRDLPYVESVTFYLHPTFKNRKIKVIRSIDNPNCSLAIWTWGLFKVTAVVETKSGDSFKLAHDLRYDREIMEKRLTPVHA